jgi:hypothetical protein
MKQDTSQAREEIARIIGSYVVRDDHGGPDTEVLHDVIGGDYDEATRRVYELADAVLASPSLRQAFEALGAFLSGYPGGINDDLDAAARLARAALKAAPPSTSEGEGNA